LPPGVDFPKLSAPIEKLPTHSALKNSPFSFTISETAVYRQTTVMNFAKFVCHLPNICTV